MPENSTSTKRLYFLDNLKTFLVILVILHHTAITYGGDGSWFYEEITHVENLATILLTLFVGFNQTFFLGLFFFVSGYFTPLSYEKRGAGKFIKEKLVRLSIPIVAFMFIAVPIIIFLITSSSPKEIFTSYIIKPRYWTTGPLWFVAALLIFYLGYAIIRKYTSISFKVNNNLVTSSKFLVYFGLTLGIVSFIIRLFSPDGATLPILNFQLSYFAQYIALFYAGCAAYTSNFLELLANQKAKTWTIASILLFLALVVFLVITDSTEPFKGGLQWQAFAFSIIQGVLAVSFSIVFIRLFYKKFNFTGTFSSALAGSSFGAYIIHPLIVVLISILLKDILVGQSLPKFFIVGVISVALSFTLAYLGTKVPGVRKII